MNYKLKLVIFALLALSCKRKVDSSQVNYVHYMEGKRFADIGLFVSNDPTTEWGELLPDKFGFQGKYASGFSGDKHIGRSSAGISRKVLNEKGIKKIPLFLKIKVIDPQLQRIVPTSINLTGAAFGSIDGCAESDKIALLTLTNSAENKGFQFCQTIETKGNNESIYYLPIVLDGSNGNTSVTAKLLWSAKEINEALGSSLSSDYQVEITLSNLTIIEDEQALPETVVLENNASNEDVQNSWENLAESALPEELQKPAENVAPVPAARGFEDYHQQRPLTLGRLIDDIQAIKDEAKGISCSQEALYGASREATSLAYSAVSFISYVAKTDMEILAWAFGSESARNTLADKGDKQRKLAAHLVLVVQNAVPLVHAMLSQMYDSYNNLSSIDRKKYLCRTIGAMSVKFLASLAAGTAATLTLYKILKKTKTLKATWNITKKKWNGVEFNVSDELKIISLDNLESFILVKMIALPATGNLLSARSAAIDISKFFTQVERIEEYKKENKIPKN